MASDRLRQQFTAAERVWRSYMRSGCTAENYGRILRTGREIVKAMIRKKAKRGSKA